MGSTHSAPEAGQHDEQWQDLTLTVSEVIARARSWLLYFVVGVFGPYLLLWGLPELPSKANLLPFVRFFVLSTLVFLVVYVISAILHEVLHVLAMVVVARAPIRSIRCGLQWRDGVAFVHTDEPMTLGVYRFVLVLPGFLLGFIPSIVGILIGSGWVTVYGFVMLVSSIGDIAILQLLRTLDADRLVRDHPRKVGCQVKKDFSTSR